MVDCQHGQREFFSRLPYRFIVGQPSADPREFIPMGPVMRGLEQAQNPGKDKRENCYLRESSPVSPRHCRHKLVKTSRREGDGTALLGAHVGSHENSHHINSVLKR